MFASVAQEPDRSGPILYVGQDVAGNWLVQDEGRRLEGRFVSMAAAMHYAQAERGLYHAQVRMAADPLSPLIPFAPVDTRGRVLRAA